MSRNIPQSPSDLVDYVGPCAVLQAWPKMTHLQYRSKRSRLTSALRTCEITGIIGPISFPQGLEVFTVRILGPTVNK